MWYSVKPTASTYARTNGPVTNSFSLTVKQKGGGGERCVLTFVPAYQMVTFDRKSTIFEANTELTKITGAVP